MEGKLWIHPDGVKATDPSKADWDHRLLGAGDTGGPEEAQKDSKDSQQGGAPLKFCLEALR